MPSVVRLIVHLVLSPAILYYEFLQDVSFYGVWPRKSKGVGLWTPQDTPYPPLICTIHVVVVGRGDEMEEVVEEKWEVEEEKRLLRWNRVDVE